MNKAGIIAQITSGDAYINIIENIFGLKTECETIETTGMKFEDFKKLVGNNQVIIQFPQTKLYGVSYGYPDHTVGYYNGKFINPYNGKQYNSIESLSKDSWGVNSPKPSQYW